MFSCNSNSSTVPLLHVGFFYVTFPIRTKDRRPATPQRRSQQSLSIAGYSERHNDEMDSVALHPLDL